MAKDKSIYTCNECGASSPKWLGKCPGCGAWNTLVESVAESATGKIRFHSLAKSQPVATRLQRAILRIVSDSTPRGVNAQD